jgi:hypothetical protein
MIEQKPKSGVPELVVVALKIVAAELIDHDYDDELGMTVVSRGATAKGRAEGGCQRNDNAQGSPSGGGFHREGSLHSRLVPPKSNAGTTRHCVALKVSRMGSLAA